MGKDDLQIGKYRFSNRLFTGTGKFGDLKKIKPMLEASGSELITVALRRVDLSNPQENVLGHIPSTVKLLPNTSGARNAEQAVRIARIAKAAGLGDLIKIEVIRDSLYLMPDNHETLKATEILVKEGFTVLPYVLPDLVIAKDLQNAGAAAVMPLGSPIGSNRGLETAPLLRLLIEQCEIPVIVDAGIGQPSQAAQAMEMGADAVLVNTAIATAVNPVQAGKAFSLAVRSGRLAFISRLREVQELASPSSPLTGFLFEENHELF